MKRFPLTTFFVITFAITWGLGAVIFVFGDALTARFGDFDYGSPFWGVLFHTAVYAPAIAAFIVIGVVKGRVGIRSFFGRIFKWRVGIGWYLFVFLGFPAMYAAARLLMIALGREVPGYGFDVWWGWLPWALLNLVADPGPVEELGWRGFALPMLQRRFSALTASVILGVIWGVWHLPSFFISGMNQTNFAIPAFILGTVALAVLITVVYNGTGGSVLLAFLIHWLHNATNGQFVGHGLSYSNIVLGAAAVVLVLVLGWRNLGRAKVTEPLDVPWEEKKAESEKRKAKTPTIGHDTGSIQ
jgi:membrane protease YdiL (CAAX protease family)